MADEHDDWMSGLGVNISALRQAASDAASSVADNVTDAASMVATAASDAASSVVGATSDAASSVTTAASDAASYAASSVADAASSVVDAASDTVSKAVDTVEDAASSVAKKVEDAAPGVLQTLNEAGKDVADFQKGFGEGVFEGVKSLVETVDPLTHTLVDAKKTYDYFTDDKAKAEQDRENKAKFEALKGVASYAVNTVIDPAKANQQLAGAATSIATNVENQYDQAAASGHRFEFVGKVAGQATVVAATMAAGAGEAEVADIAVEGTDAATTLGQGGADVSNALREGEGVVDAADSAANAGRSIAPPEPFDPAPSFVDPGAPTVPGEPPTLRTPGLEPFDPAPSYKPPISPMADSVRPPGNPIAPAEPFDPAPSFVDPGAPTVPGEPPTLRTPGVEPFDPAPSYKPPISPMADSVRPPGNPIVTAEPIDPAPSIVDPAAPTLPGEPPTLRSPGRAASDKLFQDLTDEEVDAAIENAQGGTGLELPGKNPQTGEGLVKVEIKGDPTKDIPHHDNMTFKGIEDTPGAKVEVRRHSANPNAPEGSYARDNPTTQINSVKPKEYRLPDGTYKPLSDMGPEEKAAAHLE